MNQPKQNRSMRLAKKILLILLTHLNIPKEQRIWRIKTGRFGRTSRTLRGGF